MLDKLMSNLKELYGEQLALESSIDIVSPRRLTIYTPCLDRTFTRFGVVRE